MTSPSSLVAALAALPAKGDAPRVIQQPEAVFLVSRAGEVWRVYDTEALGVTERKTPSAKSGFRHRLFVALARNVEVRAHTFSADAPREIDAVSLQSQLDSSASA